MLIPRHSPEQAARARVFEAARNAYGRAQALGTGGAVRREGDIEVWAGPFMHPYHGWMSAAVSGARIGAALDTALRLYQPLRTGMFVSIGPDARDESAFRAALRARKFRCCYHVPVMHLDLRTWTPAAVEARRRGARDVRWLESQVRLERVRDWEPLREFSVADGGPGTTPLSRRRWEFRRREATATPPRMMKWIAWEANRPIGTAMLFLHGTTALVLDVGVAPDRRERGLGTALLLEVCRHARELGLHAAVLSASGRGVGLYQKLGFTDAGRWSEFVLSGTAIAKLRFD